MDKRDALVWRKSRRCSSNACVEVARTGDRALLRDSKDPGGVTLSLTGAEWAAFKADVAHGEFRI